MKHAVPVCLLALVLVVALPAWGTILHVPGDFPGIQAAFDASADRDTVIVEHGTWMGLYVSPVHNLTLCSNYLFSHDSTDINETILDGEYAGTILDIVTDATSTLTLCGFTMIHGQGTRPDIYSHCDKGGAINMENAASAVIRDMVFRDCRAPQSAAVLNHANVCGADALGRLEIRNIACYGNTLTSPDGASNGCINIRSRFNTTIIDRVFYHGSELDSWPIYAYLSRKDTLEISNVTLANCQAKSSFLSSTRTRYGIGYTNIRVVNQPGVSGATLEMQNNDYYNGTSTVRIKNLEIDGVTAANDPILWLTCFDAVLEMDSIKFNNNRLLSDGEPMFYFYAVSNRGTLRHLDMHDNVSGDSTSHVGSSLLFTRRTSLLDSRIANNRAILPPSSNPAASGGNYVLGAMVRNSFGDVRYENLVFENNRVEDLDNYSAVPDFGYTANYGRELFASCYSAMVDGVLVRNSRQPNIIPETLAGDGITLSGMSNTLSFGGSKLSVRNVLLEDCDDGGIELVGDTLLVDNVILRNVGRAAFYIGDNLSPNSPPYYRFRNVLIENIDATLNHLSPSNQRYSQQAVLSAGLADDYNGQYPTYDLENVTVTGCDGMRHLFNFFQPATLRMRNCLFHNNAYNQMVEWNLPITQDWNYNLVEEAVPGTGNLVGLDPRFDPELGAPYLAQDSPCIDAGDPDAACNDLEDPANPGFPLWPSLGNLRSDIGYTGGPHASLAPDTTWAALPDWQPTILPQAFALGAPWPNPFNPVTQIPLELTRPSLVRLEVFNLLGQRVAVLHDGLLPAGRRALRWDAQGQASGLYFVTLTVDLDKTATRAVTLLR